MMLIDTYVAPSAIEGVGVFTVDFIPKGTLIWKLEPAFDRLIGEEALADAPDHMQAFFTRYAYPLHDDPSTLVLEVDNGRFMNHNGTDANTDFTLVTQGTARRDIQAGEELTCNYGEFDPGFMLLPSYAAKRKRHGNGAAQMR